MAISNLDRLKLELSNRQYLTENQYSLLLAENGLEAGAEYSPKSRRALLSTVLDVLEILANDVDLFRRIESEFTTVSAAYEALSDRLLKVKNKIAAIDAQDGAANGNCFSMMYIGG